MMFNAQFTRWSGQYFSIRGLQYSTWRLPAASAGQFGDQFVPPEVVDVVPFVVVVVAGGGGEYVTSIDFVTEFPALSCAVSFALEPSEEMTSFSVQLPSSSIEASYGPEYTFAPGSDVPAKVTTLSWTLAPSDGEVM